jgi:hypothetical protein
VRQRFRSKSKRAGKLIAHGDFLNSLSLRERVRVRGSIRVLRTRLDPLIPTFSRREKEFQN